MAEISEVISQLRTTLAEIAEAIRSRTGSTQKIAVSDFAKEINGMSTFCLGENTKETQINVKEKLPDLYDKLSAENFVLVCTAVKGYIWADGSEKFGTISQSFGANPVISYDCATGILTIKKVSCSYNQTVPGGYGVYPASASIAYKVYVIFGPVVNL